MAWRCSTGSFVEREISTAAQTAAVHRQERTFPFAANVAASQRQRPDQQLSRADSARLSGIELSRVVHQVGGCVHSWTEVNESATTQAILSDLGQEPAEESARSIAVHLSLAELGISRTALLDQAMPRGNARVQDVADLNLLSFSCSTRVFHRRRPWP